MKNSTLIMIAGILFASAAASESFAFSPSRLAGSYRSRAQRCGLDVELSGFGGKLTAAVKGSDGSTHYYIGASSDYSAGPGRITYHNVMPVFGQSYDTTLVVHVNAQSEALAYEFTQKNPDPETNRPMVTHVSCANLVQPTTGQASSSCNPDRNPNCSQYEEDQTHLTSGGAW